MSTWKTIGIRAYKKSTGFADAFVFGAYRPTCLWAWSVYMRNSHSSGVENSFRRAKKQADDHINFLEPETKG